MLAFPGQGDVLVYPANFVAKRWERREMIFLEHGYQPILQNLRWVAEQNAPPNTSQKSKPWWKLW